MPMHSVHTIAARQRIGQQLYVVRTRQDSSDSRARTHCARARTKRLVVLAVVEVWSVIYSCSWLIYDYNLAVLNKHAVSGLGYALTAKVVYGSLLCVAAIYDIFYTRHLRVISK